MPQKTTINIAKKYAPVATNVDPPKTAPAIMPIIGSLAWHGINVVSMIVIFLSLSFSIVRVAIIPGTPHPELISIGMNDLPESPNLRKILSIIKAIRAM